MTTGNVPARSITRDEARRRTDEFKVHTEAWLEELAALYIDHVWYALDYETFDEYCAAELGSIPLPRAGRSEAVLTLRDAGLSIRAISSALGLGVATIHREIEAGVPNGTPDLPNRAQKETIGLDGKRYPASAPTPPKSPEPEPVTIVIAEPEPTPPSDGVTEDSPGQTDRVRQALEKAVAKPQEPAAEPEAIEAEVVESEPVNAEVVKPKPKPINDPKPEPAPEPKPVEEPKSVPPGGLTEDSPGMIDAKAAGAVTEPAPAEEVAAQGPGARTVDELVHVLVDATVALEALTEGWEDLDRPPMPVVPFTAGACAVVDSVRQRLWDVGMALHNTEVSSVIDRAVKPRSRRGRRPKPKPPFDHKPPLTVAELGGPAIPNVAAV